VFSPDSQRVAYVADTNAEDGKLFVAVDGKESTHYDGVTGVKFESAKQRQYVTCVGRNLYRVEYAIA